MFMLDRIVRYVMAAFLCAAFTAHASAGAMDCARMPQQHHAPIATEPMADHPCHEDASALAATLAETGDQHPDDPTQTPGNIHCTCHSAPAAVPAVAGSAASTRIVHLTWALREPASYVSAFLPDEIDPPRA